MDVEHAAIAAHAALLEDQRTGAFDLQRNRHDRDDGDAEDAADQTTHKVKDPLPDLVSQFEFRRAHRHEVTARTAAQHPAHPSRARLITTDLFDPVKDGQTEMHRQAHALDLLQVGQQRVAAFGRNVHVNFIQRFLTEPVHEVVVVCLDLHAVDGAADVCLAHFQQRDARDLLGPVLFQVLQHRFGIVAGRDNTDQTAEALGIRAGQQLFQHDMAQDHHEAVHEGDRQQEIPGRQHRRFRQGQTGHIQKRQQEIEMDRNFHFFGFGSCNDIFALIKGKKGQNIRHAQQKTCFDHLIRAAEIYHLVEDPIKHEPHQRRTDGQ